MINSFGLALGSGGARGLAHLGVVKAIDKLGIKISGVSGSSIGALVGAWYALYGNIDELEEIAMSADWRFLSGILISPTVKGGLIDSKKIEKFLRGHFGNSRFQDLKIPLRIVATDLQSGEAVIFAEGDLVTAITASMCVPMIFKPIRIGEQILVDGGISMPIPVKLAKSLSKNKVIAVNLDGKDILEPIKNKLSNVVMVSQQSVNVIRYNLARYEADQADIVVEPRTGIFGLVGWKEFLNAKGVIDSGEEAFMDSWSKFNRL